MKAFTQHRGLVGHMAVGRGTDVAAANNHLARVVGGF